MLVVDAMKLQVVGERDEPEAQRALVQHCENIGQNRIARRARDAAVKGAIEIHQLLAIARAISDAADAAIPASAAISGSRRPLGREPDAIGLVDQPHFENAQDLVERNRLHHHALARDDLNQPFQHQPVERLMHRRAADFELPADLRLVEIGAGPVFQPVDAALDLDIGAITQRQRRAAPVISHCGSLCSLHAINRRGNSAFPGGGSRSPT